MVIPYYLCGNKAGKQVKNKHLKKQVMNSITQKIYNIIGANGFATLTNMPIEHDTYKNSVQCYIHGVDFKYNHLRITFDEVTGLYCVSFSLIVEYILWSLNEFENLTAEQVRQTIKKVTGKNLPK